jgi:DNA transformation protein
MTRENDDFLEFVIDQLQQLAGVRPRRMFGAHGLYKDDVFFAIVDKGALYFRTGDANRGDYVEKGMKPFEYKPGGVLKNYYQVPVDVLEDDELLCRWAEDAVSAQIEHQTKSPRKTRRKKR